MTLPIDFMTSLWMHEVPVWELEALPCPDGPASPDPAAVSAGDDALAPPPAPSVPFQAMLVFDPPADTPAGYRLVFKGFKMSARVLLLPFDTPLSRPWVEAVAPQPQQHHHRHHPVAEVMPENRPAQDPDATRDT